MNADANTRVTSQLERDLYCLSTAGYLVHPDVIDAELLETISTQVFAFEREVNEFVGSGGTAILRHSWPLVTTRCLYAVCQELQDVAMLPGIQSIVRGYLGPMVLRDCLLQTNMPDDRNIARGVTGKVSYHRDTLWPDSSCERMYLHVFLALTDLSFENGAPIVVPGSHRLREPGYYFKDTDPRESAPGIDYRVYEQEYFGSATRLLASKGSIIFLDPMLIHTQGINVSDRHRAIVNTTYRASHVTGCPPLLNALRIAKMFSRVPVRNDLCSLLESNERLPAHFGPLGLA